MKKNLLLLIVVIFASFNVANAQACPNADDTLSGPHWEWIPNTTVNLPSGTVGTTYSACLYFFTPSTDSATILMQSVVATMDSMTLTSIVGLPSGFSTSTNPSNGHFMPLTSSWIHFNCSPPTVADTGMHPLTITFLRYLTYMNFSDTLSKTVTGYVIYIADTTTGIPALDPMKFEVSQNMPNPVFSGNTEIDYTTPIAGKMSFNVFNMLGQNVITRSLNAKQGINQIYINSKELAAGVYMYSLNNGTQTITKRMVIGSK